MGLIDNIAALAQIIAWSYKQHDIIRTNDVLDCRRI